MKIRLVSWLNLAAACLCFAVAILGFIVGEPINIVLSCLNIIAGAWNAFVFMHAVSVWWERSLKVAAKFAFTCPKCEHQFVPTFWTWFFVPHVASKRYMKCENCKKISWMRRK